MKINCHQKAQQSWEFFDSMKKDVIVPLQELKQAQDQEATEMQREGKQLVK